MADPIQIITPAERLAARQALLDKYAQSQDMSDVQAAQDNAGTQNTIAGIGQGLAMIGNSGGVAAGGPQTDTSGYNAIRKSAQDALRTAYEAHQAKVAQVGAQIQMQQGFDSQDQALGIANNQNDIARSGQDLQAKSQDLQAHAQAQHDAEFNKSQDQALKFHNDEMAKANALLQAEKDAGKFDTGGQKATDDTFAKEVPDWINGGQAKAAKSLARLQDASSRLDAQIKDSDAYPISGTIAGKLQQFNPNAEARNIPAEVKESALSAVKEVMGPRITQQEVQNVVDSWYNPSLSEAENAAKLKANITSLQQQYNEKNAMTQYFTGNRGSLKGYTPSAGPMSSPQQTSNSDDTAAAAWAQSHPDDPRAAAILSHLKSGQ